MTKLAVVRNSNKVVAIVKTSSEASEIAKKLVDSGVERSSISCRFEESSTILQQDVKGVCQTIKKFLTDLLGYAEPKYINEVRNQLKAFGCPLSQDGTYRTHHLQTVHNYLKAL